MSFNVCFILTPPNALPCGLEVKYRPILTDDQKLKHVAQKK